MERTYSQSRLRQHERLPRGADWAFAGCFYSALCAGTICVGGIVRYRTQTHTLPREDTGEGRRTIAYA